MYNRGKSFLKITFVLLLIFSLAYMGPAASTHPAAEDEVYRAAVSGLPSFLDLIPVNREHDYGFENREEFDRAVVGRPIQMYLLSDELSPLSIDEWRVPVLVDGAHRALLTVARVDGLWRAVDFGAAVLARELGTFKSPGEKVLLRCFQRQCDFVVIPAASRNAEGVEEGRVYPLQSARLNLPALDKRAEPFFTFQEIKGLILSADEAISEE
jgi:hypothetical protein